MFSIYCPAALGEEAREPELTVDCRRAELSEVRQAEALLMLMRWRFRLSGL